jgi:hypothetical protein
MRRKTKLCKQSKRLSGLSLRRYVLLAIVGILAVSSVFMTVESATSGVEVSNLRQKENQLILEKRNLEETLVRSLSINDLEDKSSEMGFGQPSTMVYVSGSQETVAQLP